jgi:hypothetical protein
VVHLRVKVLEKRKKSRPTNMSGESGNTYVAGPSVYVQAINGTDALKSLHEASDLVNFRLRFIVDENLTN